VAGCGDLDFDIALNRASSAKRERADLISFKIEHLSTAKSCSRILIIFTEGRFLGLRIRADSENEERRMFGIGGVGRASFDEEFGGTLGWETQDTME
jgi:hypothetical protein